MRLDDGLYWAILLVGVPIGFLCGSIDARILYAWFGIWVVIGMVYGLKRLVGKDEPWKQRPNDPNDYGMPSGHSAAAAYSWVIGFRLFPQWAFYIGLVGLPLVVYVIHARVYYGYHTLLQGLLGALLGTMVASIWRIKNDSVANG